MVEVGTTGSNTISSRACATETYARTGVPANTTSAGSSSVCRVAVSTSFLMSTMLTLSEISFTTQACVFEKARTEIGSTPTLITLVSVRFEPLIANTSSVPFAVFTLSSFVPSGVTSNGCTCATSKFVNAASGTPGADTGMVSAARSVACSETLGCAAAPVCTVAALAVADAATGATEWTPLQPWRAARAQRSKLKTFLRMMHPEIFFWQAN